MDSTMESATTEATTKEGIEIKGKDVIKLTAPEILPPAGQLLTEAQDLVGAINELKKDLDEGGGGGSDKWVRPSDWPELRDPESNEIILLVARLRPEYTQESFAINTFVDFIGSDIRAGDILNVDWGDGNSETWTSEGVGGEVASHTYNGNGLILNNGTPVYVVSIKPQTDCFLHFPAITYTIIDAQVGADVKLHSTVFGRSFLYHVKFFGWKFDDEYANESTFSLFPQTIRSVETTIPWETIPAGMFSGKYILTDFDFSQVKSVKKNGFSSCYSLSKINAPNLTDVAEYAFNACYNLRSIVLPQLTTLGNYAFRICYGLTSFSAPQLINIGEYAFQNNYNLQNIIYNENCVIGNYAFYGCYLLNHTIQN